MKKNQLCEIDTLYNTIKMNNSDNNNNNSLYNTNNQLYNTNKQLYNNKNSLYNTTAKSITDNNLEYDNNISNSDTIS